MSSRPRYSNATTDLVRAFARIEEYKQQKTLRGWVVHSGSVFKLGNTGYVEALFENDLQLTKVTSLNDVAAGKFFYDANLDILYAQATSGNITDAGKIYKAGDDWDALKDWAIDQASTDIEALLDARFPRPVPESPHATAAEKWDPDLRMACAKIACSHIAARREPKIYEPTPNVPAQLEIEGRRIIEEYNSGARRFSWELTRDEAGQAQAHPLSTSTGDGVLQAKAWYDGVQEFFARVKIVTGGAVGVAEYQYSFDDGATWNGEAIATSNLWKQITGLVASAVQSSEELEGIWVRFFDRGGTFDVGDEWQIEVQSSKLSMPRSPIGSARISM